MLLLVKEKTIMKNLENTKKKNEEIEDELIEAEKKYNVINQNLKEIQLKLSGLKENKARNEATIEGMENRKKDLLYSIKNELNIDNENSILPQSDLNDVSPDNLPTIEGQSLKAEKIKKKIGVDLSVKPIESKEKVVEAAKKDAPKVEIKDDKPTNEKK